MAHKIFLSYRRSDTAHHAMALKLLLEQYFPDVTVFVDTASIAPGEHWPDRLKRELQDASVLVALMGPHWRFSRDGHDRFSDTNDWVRAEIAHALDRTADIVLPIAFEDAESSEPDTQGDSLRALPADIAAFGPLQQMRLRSGSYGQDVEQIARALGRMLKVEHHTQGVVYPRPNTLKSKAPVISQHEFDTLKHEDSSLSGWHFSGVITQGGDSELGFELRKTFEFRNFKRAFSFMNAAALFAESRPHHPTWTNKWNQVSVQLRTFDAGQKVTWYDIEMASKMNDIAKEVDAAKKPSWPYNLKS